MDYPHPFLTFNPFIIKKNHLRIRRKLSISRESPFLLSRNVGSKFKKKSEFTHMEKGGSKSNFLGFGKVNCIELNLNLSGTEWYRDYWS